jgi:hypothetical protein
MVYSRYCHFTGKANEHLPGRWVGRAAATDNTFCAWPPRSPDLTVCDFFLFGFVKDNAYVPPLPKTRPELRERINTSIGNGKQDMLETVWREWEYRLDMCRATRGAYSDCIPFAAECHIYIYIYMSYRTANLQTLHFKYFFNKYPY